MRLEEIQKRKAEIANQINSLSGAELDKAMEEVENLNKEERSLLNQTQETEKREKLNSLVQSGFSRGRAIEIPQKEERSYGIDSVEYRSAFFKRLMGKDLNDVEKRAMTTNANSAGVAVPTLTLNKIYEKIANASIVYNLVTVSNLAGTVIIPYENVTNDVQRKGEGQDSTILDDTLASLELGCKKYIKRVRLTCELITTAIDALESYVVRMLGKKLAQAIDYDIINGTGTNGATGILTTLTPIETATAGEIDYDDLCDLFAAVPAIAKKNATLLMSTNTLWKKIMKIKDNERRPIFNAADGKVLGREVTECDDVPDGTIIFGDLEEYMFNWSKPAELRKSEESAFASGDTEFRILALADGGLLDLGAIKALKEKTTTPSSTPEATT